MDEKIEKPKKVDKIWGHDLKWRKDKSPENSQKTRSVEMVVEVKFIFKNG